MIASLAETPSPCKVVILLPQEKLSDKEAILLEHLTNTNRIIQNTKMANHAKHIQGNGMTVRGLGLVHRENMT